MQPSCKIQGQGRHDGHDDDNDVKSGGYTSFSWRNFLLQQLDRPIIRQVTKGDVTYRMGAAGDICSLMQSQRKRASEGPQRPPAAFIEPALLHDGWGRRVGFAAAGRARTASGEVPSRVRVCVWMEDLRKGLREGVQREGDE